MTSPRRNPVYSAAHRRPRPAPPHHRTRPPSLRPARRAVALRAGTCTFPTCTVPAERSTKITTNPGRGTPPVETWIRSADDTTAPRPSPGMRAAATRTPSDGPCLTPNATDASTNHYLSEAPLRRARSGPDHSVDLLDPPVPSCRSYRVDRAERIGAGRTGAGRVGAARGPLRPSRRGGDDRASPALLRRDLRRTRRDPVQRSRLRAPGR